MADFKRAHHRLAELEAGYVNHPADLGGETIFGITRRFHPSWSGWALVDELKKLPGFPGTAERNETLRQLASKFYEARYWEPVGGPHLSQRVAEELLDQGVHMGPARAVEHLQRACNILSNRGTRWPAIVADGQFGPRTLNAARAACASYEPEVLGALDGYQCSYLISRMEADTSQQAFAVGWLRRVYMKRTGETP